ncbi:CHAT domain-containing protein [Flavivirga jejuensis]|uniref:CHAT domain-containing protein n=1 Tax=Flavivirga jejuensis TaxID=870487 RepID=A0ABT8WST0_9FLAO|nr:CHAT domain-containing protein [Flavivirga jejuensis]MDO5976243.1 CHAT domain-containing protein [Flavivirga jejuensis]
MKILASDASTPLKQQQIDSFLLTHEKTIPKKILADCYHDLGSKWYYRNWRKDKNKENLEAAILVTDKAFNIKKNEEKLVKGSLEKTLYNLGYFNSKNDAIYEAISAYSYLIEKGKDNGKILSANRELGKLYALTGDFYKALNRFDAYTSSHSTKDTLSRKQILGLLEINLSKAETYAIMGFEEFSNEIDSHLKSADSLLKNVSDANNEFRNSIDQLYGNRLLKARNYKEAIYYHKLVIKDSLQLEPNNLARVYNSLAYSQIKRKDLDSALVNLNKAITLDPDYTDPYENMGDLYISKNKFEKGLSFYQKAIVLGTSRSDGFRYDNLVSIQNLEVSANKVVILQNIITKANGWLKYYQYDSNKEHLIQALKTFSLADKLVDLIRSESTEYQSKLFWREQSAELYMKAVEVCFLLEKPKEAYYFMERNKALLLLEDITSENAKEISKLPNVIAKREFELKRSIFLSENELQNMSTTLTAKKQILKEKIYENKHEYSKFMDSISISFPEYSRLKGKLNILPYQYLVDNYVSEEDYVLQYILNNEQGYGLLTLKEGPFFFKLDGGTELIDEILQLFNLLRTLVSDREKNANYNNVSYGLFKKLIPETVYNKLKGKKLLIIADYVLQQIPFEALVVNNTNNTVRYLIEDTEIRYAYSMSYLSAKKQIIRNPKKSILGVAPGEFNIKNLPKLNFSTEEVNQAARIYNGDVFLNKDATKSNLLDNIYDHKVIHLSTHADIGKNGNHWIAFSDKKLFLNEIYITKNQAEMVVLSACNTSSGELKKGEGIMSLARGFFHSGAKSVVSSLWTIDDKISKDIIIEFYRGLDKGLTKSASLREAKLKIIQKYRNTAVSPSYWGALIVIGDNTPIQNYGFFKRNWLYLSFGTFMFGLLIFFLNNRLKKIVMRLNIIFNL